MGRGFAGQGNNDVMKTGTISDTVARVGQVTHLKSIDDLSYQFVTTGSLAGSWKIEVSNDYAGPGDAGDGAPLAAGDWSDITALYGANAYYYPAITAVAAASVKLAAAVFLPFRAIRPTFTPTSGTGIAYAYVIGKGL